MTKPNTLHPTRHSEPTTKALRLAYLLFERSDQRQANAFLRDFGLEVADMSDEALYYRGTDTSPFCYRVSKSGNSGFIGFGLEVANRKELEKLTRLPGASTICVAEYPGGGELVRLTDPSGFTVEAICGQQPSAPIAHRAPLRLNYDAARPRVNTPQRQPASPPEVLRLGHLVLEVARFQQTCSWYTQHFGFIPSDVQVLPDGSPAVVFLRLDLGDTPTDHHTLALAQGFMPLYSHSAYELVDADAVGMGQKVLREQGWNHAWGIGRHILGSQIFDYWQDPWGAKHEHYCDGDIFTAEKPMGVHPVSREAMSQWGQVMPSSFTKPKLTLKSAMALISNLRHSPDLTIKKLITLAKLFA